MKTAFRLSAVAALLLSNPASKAEETGLAAILPAKLEDASGKEVDPATLKGKTVGLYFSAHWCPPCRAFTPSLVKFRDNHAEEDFEIVFVSLDHSAGDKKTYIREMEMKWLTVPGAGSKEARELAERFQVQGIPMLVILAPDGSIVTTNGREEVMLSADTALRTWKEKAPSQ
jgi:nucleoredoxin